MIKGTKKSKSLTLYIPALNSTKLSEKLFNSLSNTELTAFKRFFSKAKISHGKALDHASRCFELLSVCTQNKSGSLPVAALYYANLKAAKTDQSTPKPVKDKWIYNVSPVFLYPDMTQLILKQDMTEHISDIQARQICQSINDFFNESEQDKAWELVYYGKNNWYLVSDIKLINQPMIADMLGMPLLKPDYDSALQNTTQYWIQALNEIQMLLFSLQPNKQQLCNSLWLWGESYLDKSSLSEQAFSADKLNSTSWDCVYSENILLKQLADYTNKKYKTNKNAETILADFLSDNSNEKTILIELNELEQAVKYNDPIAIIDVLKNYEQQWFKPLTDALLSSSLASVQVISNGEQVFQLNRRKFKSWWKFNKSSGSILESLY